MSRVESRGIKIRDLTEAALLVGIGFLLHAFFPSIVMGMKPDFSLAMMFIVLIVKKDLKLGFLAALATGIFTALTTNFPGGQYANLLDKMVTFLVLSGIISLLGERINNKIGVGIITAIGTIISGVVFLSTASLLVGLPGPFLILLYTIVLPAALVNTITSIIIFLAFSYSKKTIYNKQVKRKELNV